MFEYIEKVDQIKKVSIEVKVGVVWRKNVACWRIFFTIFQGVAKFSPLPRSTIALPKILFLKDKRERFFSHCVLIRFFSFSIAAPNTKKPYRIYKVSLANLTGQQPKDDKPVMDKAPASPRNGQTLPAISVNDYLTDRDSTTPSPTFHEEFRMPNGRTAKLRTDTVSTISSDSGIHHTGLSINSPPVSPF